GLRRLARGLPPRRHGPLAALLAAARGPPPGLPRPAALAAGQRHRARAARLGAQRACERVVGALVTAALDHLAPPASGEGLGRAVAAHVDAAVHARAGDLAAQRDLLDGRELARQRALGAAPRVGRELLQARAQRGERIGERVEALTLRRAGAAYRHLVG